MASADHSERRGEYALETSDFNATTSIYAVLAPVWAAVNQCSINNSDDGLFAMLRYYVMQCMLSPAPPNGNNAAWGQRA